MRNYCSIICLLVFFGISLSGIAQFTDNFEDGDFISNPTWAGDNALFTVTPYTLDPTNQMLRSNSPGQSDYYLSTPSFIVEETSWEFFFNLQFGTSGVNYFDAFLVADVNDLNTVQNGYFLRFGRTEDDISFWKRVAGSDVLLIDGDDGQVGSSSENPFYIRVTRDDSGLWTIFVDEGATGTYSVFGTTSDADITTTTSFGFRIVQSGAASPINSHWFDDVEVAEILPDVAPPEVLTVEVLSLNELLVTFNEPLDEGSAENTNNYDLAPLIGSPQSATLNAGPGTEVTLVFANDMANGETYVLSVVNVEDIIGNAMALQPVEFTVIIPEVATFKDVVFNEIMADPNPPVNELPDEEYLEIYNASNKYIQLENWELVNSTTVRTLPEYLLAPGSFVILCNSSFSAAFEQYGDVLGISSFVAMTNGTDSLTLNNAEGELIDVVVYFDSWYNDPEKADGGWSLELINPNTECSGSQNWTASNDPNGGTPGGENSVFDTTPDTSPPALTGFNIIDPQNIQLFFNEPLDPQSLDDAVVSIDPATGLSSATMAGDYLSIFLVLDTPIDTAVSYTVTIQNITDCSGNSIGDENSIEFLIGYVPGLHEILINEVIPDPSPSVGLPEQEYIELYNPTDKLFDLSACSISGATFLPNTFIQPEGFLVLVSPETSVLFEDFSNVVEMASMSSTFLTNGGRELLFLNPDGTTIDRIAYNLSWYDDPNKTDGGWSIERINPEEPCRGGDNWRASVATIGGTPGTQNSVYDLNPDERAPQLLTIIYIDSTSVELVFDEVLDEASAISAGYSVVPELIVFDIENITPDNSRIGLTFSEAMVPNQVYTISIIGLTDCSGNEFENEGSLQFGRPGPATSGSLIINEVLFNQRTGGSDFVELYNNSNAIVSLQDWLLGNLGNDQFRTITEEGFVLFPGNYLAVTDDKANIILEYPLAPTGRVYQAVDIPTYNNGDGQAVLLDPNGNTIDRFDYEEDMHFSLLRDVKGVSLERIDFNRPSDDRTNWMSAAENVNWATPGYENSQFMQSVQEDGEVWVDPEVFSPDNDGYQDVLNINYRFDQSGLVGNIKIFDSSGRLVRRLMQNELLGTEGVISWDGTGDNMERARVGIHVVYMEVFSSDGYTKGYKLSCVVASRF